jgi:hypothetical protein
LLLNQKKYLMIFFCSLSFFLYTYSLFNKLLCNTKNKKEKRRVNSTKCPMRTKEKKKYEDTVTVYTFIYCITDMLIVLLLVGIQLSLQTEIEYKYLGK